MTVPSWCVVILRVLLIIAGLVCSSTSTTVRYLDADNGTDLSSCLTNGSLSSACQSLRYAITNYTIDSAVVSDLQLFILPGIYYYGDSEIRPYRPTNVLIQKVPGAVGEVIFRCNAPLTSEGDNYTNLVFSRGQNVTIRGIAVEQCGPREAGIYNEFFDGLYFIDCIFRNNTGSGLWNQQCMHVEVHNCTFMDNAAYSVETDFSIRSFSPAGMSVLFNGSNIASIIKVIDSSFINNTALLTAQENRPRAYTPSAVGDGGGIFIRFNSTRNSRVEIINCTFLNNTADDIGGALYAPMINGSENNSLIISHSVFQDSRASVTGGAAAIDMFDVGDGNFVEFMDCQFINNAAESGGGGVSFVLEDSLTESSPGTSVASRTTVISFTGCVFEGNTSPSGGAALGLISNARIDQPPLTAAFKDCNFTQNTASSDGAVFVFRFPMMLEGRNRFTENSGGGLAVISSRIHSQGDLVFMGNTAEEGAGLTLIDQSLVNLMEGTSILFKGNRAEAVGGAMVVRNPSVGLDIRTNSLYNHLCFFQYEIEKNGTQTLIPNEWQNVSVSFINNTAGRAGAAIFASDLSRCIFTSRECPLESISKLNEYQRSIFHESPFHFESNNVLERPSDSYVRNISTAPSFLNVTAGQQAAYAPGDVVEYVLRAADQSGTPRGGIWRLEDDSLPINSSVYEYFSVGEEPKTHSEVFQVAAYDESLCTEVSQQQPLMKTGQTQTLDVFIIQAVSGDVVYETTIDIDVSCCHPGYTYDSETGLCVFDDSDPNILRPDDNNMHVYLQPGHYAGYYEDPFTDEVYLTTVLAPAVFLNCTQEGSRTGCLYDDSRPNDQCVDDRHGYMCGRCPDGQGVDLTLGDCKDCTAGDAVGLVIICLLIVAFCFLVLVFNIGLPNDLKGFLFYAQVVGYVYQHGAQEFSWDYHLSRLFGFSLYLPICPFTTLPALWTVAFGFLPSILATMAVVTYIVCARFIRPLNTRTVFDGLWFIFLFVYKYTADTVANALKCVRVEGNAVEDRGYIRLAYFFDGTVPCFSGEHLALAVPSLILLVAVVILGPVFVIVISFKRFKRTQPFTDVITNGIERRCRWWAGFDLLRRFMFIAAVTIFDFIIPSYTQLCLCFTTLVVLAVLCATKPYKDYWVNLVEGLILLDLLLISLHFLNEREFRNESSEHTDFTIFLLLLPFLYVLGNFIARISLKLWKKYVPMDPLTMKYWAQTRPHNPMLIEKSKPLLVLANPSANDDTTDLPSQRTSGPQSSRSHSNTNETPVQGEREEEDVEYASLREELLDA